jgi:energy-coupling factor transporter ATP-binding protein EcfA2
MILITRPPQPPAYAERAALGQTALEATAVEGGFKAQRRYDFDSSIWGASRAVLSEASYGKCAWCESLAGYAGPAAINHYRPKSHAEGLRKGQIQPDHYWWLAYSWDNLVYSCRACHRAKRNRFPVLGQRLEPGDLSGAEQPLLLDPYGTDDPSGHLWFEDDGTVRPISERGEITIEILALNRPDLVERRQQAAALMRSALAVSEPVTADTRAVLADPHVEYGGLRRQLLKRHLARAGTETAAEIVAPKTIATVSSDIGAVWIEEVQIVNFGCFRELELRFSAPGEGREPWIVVLGANGSGKSTILRAIALALCNADTRRRLAPDASKYVNRGAGVRRGHVRIRFNQGDELRLEARRESHSFTVTGRRPKFALAGYGSTRLLPYRSNSASRRAAGPRLTNLFDPRSSLGNAELWLADPQQVSPDDFRVLASSLKTLMSVEEAVYLSRLSGKMRAYLFSTPVDLDELSAGYQSVLALSLDLCLAFGSEQKQGLSTENFEGIVLIDELEVHLHPEWKVRVVSDLRSVFPHLQFVATTHDPLCLRGLQPGELHRLERRDGTITIQQIDVPSGLDADEILTGSWFGLDTTLDPAVQDNLLRYRNLRLEGHGPDDPEVADLQHRLELSLGSYTGTSLGRVMVEAAGEFVAEQDTPSATDTKLTKDQIKERLLAYARERTR